MSSVAHVADAAAPPRLLDALREHVRSMHYSLRTEEAYVYWVRAFIRFHAALPRPGRALHRPPGL
jgi:hypothetical protein